MEKSAVINRHNLPVRAWDDPAVMLKLRWSGVNFYEFVLPNGKTVVMDPYFDDVNDAHNEYKYTPTDLSAGEWVNGGHSGQDYMLALKRIMTEEGIVTPFYTATAWGGAVTPAEEVLRYRQPVRAEQGTEPPVGTVSAELDGLTIPVPKGSEVLLHCTLAGAYNYPFKKVRIFNCNLEEARGISD